VRGPTEHARAARQQHARLAFVSRSGAARAAGPTPATHPAAESALTRDAVRRSRYGSSSPLVVPTPNTTPTTSTSSTNTSRVMAIRLHVTASSTRCKKVRTGGSL
jgi:hypothetical protein